MFGKITSDRAFAKIIKLASKLSHDDLEECANYLKELHKVQKPDRILVTVKTAAITYQFDASQLEWSELKNKFSLKTGTVVVNTEAKEIIIRVEDIINIIGEKI